MQNRLKRYWFEFDFSDQEVSEYGYLPIFGGCGITAYDYNDAIRILRDLLVRDNKFPKFRRVIENIDVSAIEDRNVVSNLGVPVWRGIWYPAFNLWQGAYTERQ